jgi:2-keto-3-deoxy-6-phosphogluconate aldolase
VLAVGGSWLAPREVVAAGKWDEVSRRVRKARRLIHDEVTR